MRISDWSSDVCSSDLFLPRQEEKLADKLSRDDTTIHTTARVVALDRRGTEEGHTAHRTGLNLTLSVKEHDGSERAAKLVVWVEDALLPNFATGKTVHVLYDATEHTEERRVGKECVSKWRY